MTDAQKIKALREIALGQPQPIRNLIDVICSQIRENGQDRYSEVLKETLAQNIQRLRDGQGMH